MNGNYYNVNPYYQIPTRQDNLNMIDEQIAKLNQMKNQINQQPQVQQHQPAINQTFQLAPNSQGGMKFASTMDDVNKEMVFADTPFFSKDLSVVWIKNTKGKIKSYELKEIIEKDEKDLQIEYLTARIEELERKYEDVQHTANVSATEDTTDTTGDDEPIGEPIEKIKSPSVSRVSKSKKQP